MSSFSTKTLFFFSTLLLIGLLGVFVYGVYIVNNKQKQVEMLQSEAGSGSKGDTLIQALKTIQNNDRDELLALNDLIITKESLVTLLELIEKTAKDLGLDIKVNSLQGTEKTTKASPSPTVNVSLTTTGSWISSITFVHAIESLPYRVIIDTTDMSTSVGLVEEGKKSSPVWRSSYQLTLYSSKDPVKTVEQ
ncbi:hypothetical protein KW790_01585 [Candidatus Parcubacteria bacterium]|nr:hypothetical protein [Candidatus Parcubacteria bacterium]